MPTTTPTFVTTTMTMESDALAPLVSLHERLLELSEPLAEAFDSRLRAIDAEMEIDVDRVGTEPLLDALLASLPHAHNVVELLPLVSEVAQMCGHGPSASGMQRHAVQALDWSIRDLLLDEYSTEQRRAFNECTGLFIELLRRASAHHDSRDNSPVETTLS